MTCFQRTTFSVVLFLFFAENAVVLYNEKTKSNVAHNEKHFFDISYNKIERTFFVYKKFIISTVKKSNFFM